MVKINDKVLLDVIGLNTRFFTEDGVIPAVNDVSFTIKKGEIFGLVGESGSGKTVTAHSIMGLVHPPGRVVSGQIIFEGSDLLTLGQKQMEDVRGNRIGMVFQEPMTALNPVLRIGEQIAEVIDIHKVSSGNETRKRTLELLRQVGFDEPEKRYIQYPHQLSGGQRQRVLMAIAIACNPSLIIADEPTTALDVATESQILGLIEGLIEKLEMSMLFITHDLTIVRSMGQSVGLMYAGRMVERNSVGEFFKKPLHPYGEGLLESIYGFSGSGRLKAIPGSVPNLSELPKGCTFHPRCPYVMDICKGDEPVIKEGGEGSMGPLLSVLDVRKYYEVRRSVFSVEKEIIKAVDGVSFELHAGKTLGVVGESGSGKSTLARCLMFLERPDSGTITFDGVNLVTASSAEIRKLRRKLQIIFQDPYSSLNPRMTVRDIIAEPIRFHRMVRGRGGLKCPGHRCVEECGHQR